MKTAHIVTDLGFGDSGKGVVTDRLCNSLAGAGPFKVLVVRYTGGSQAGHTVDLNLAGESDPLKRHIHSSFAAGTLGGFQSHMSQFCPIYPQNLVREAQVLEPKIQWPLIQNCSVDPLAPMITKYDVAWNRATAKRKDTVGVGIGATMERMQKSEYRTYMADLLSGSLLLHKLERVREYYLDISQKLGRDVYHRFLDHVYEETIDPRDALEYVKLAPTNTVILSHDNVIFEGAQGVMLDQDHGFIPDVTWGHTTSRNAVDLIRANGEFDEVTMHYVTRSYQTRHGDGPMTSRMPVVVPPDPTNVTNPYQGEFRTAELDIDLLRYALAVDKSYTSSLPCRIQNERLHVTCCDHIGVDEADRLTTQLQKLPLAVSRWDSPHRTY